MLATPIAPYSVHPFSSSLIGYYPCPSATPCRLAEAEQLLETCACTLLGVGDQLLPTVYSLLEERAEPGELQVRPRLCGGMRHESDAHDTSISCTLSCS